MSGARYRRATKKHAVRVEHTDSSVTSGFLPIPLGMDFIGVMMQAQNFIDFEMESGEQTLMNVASIKRITSTQPEEESSDDHQSSADKARAKREAQNAAQREAEDKVTREEEARRAAKKSGQVHRTAEEYDALEILGLKASATRDDIQSAYRKLVKLYHPDRLRGLGVSPKKIEFAAERLSEINNSYRVLMAAAKAAA